MINKKWEMIVNLTIQNDDDESIVEGMLYTDGDYGFYNRTATICSSQYYSTFRFNKDRMGDVLKYIADKSPLELEKYLSTVDGYKWIENGHNL